MVVIMTIGVICDNNESKGADLPPTEARNFPETLLVGNWAFVLMANVMLHRTHMVSGCSCVS